MKLFTFIADLGQEWVELWARHLRRMSWIVAKHLYDEVTVQTRQGKLSFKTFDTGMAPHFWLEREYEFGASVKCIEFLKTNGFISTTKSCNLFDIGANNGCISIGLLRAGVIDRAVGFEPHPDNFRLLEKNIRQNGLNDKMKALHAALSDQMGELTLEISPSNVGDHRIRVDKTLAKAVEGEDGRQTIHVPAWTLDHYVSQGKDPAWTPSAIWIDVQGHEGYVFAGGKDVLRQGVPAVVEVCPYTILRAGMTLEDYTRIVSSIWTHYWVERRGRFIRYPVALFNYYLDELGVDGDFCNIIFTPDSKS
jgi:FkbM family methyltransferase